MNAHAIERNAKNSLPMVAAKASMNVLSAPSHIRFVSGIVVDSADMY